MDKDENKNNALAFLKELKALCEKHNAKLGGCGCCGSPFVSINGIIQIENIDIGDTNEATVGGEKLKL